MKLCWKNPLTLQLPGGIWQGFLRIWCSSFSWWGQRKEGAKRWTEDRTDDGQVLPLILCTRPDLHSRYHTVAGPQSLQPEDCWLKLIQCDSQCDSPGEKVLAMQMCVPAQSLQSFTLCDPMDCSPPGSSVHGILQVRILEWAAMPSSRRSSLLRDRTHISCVSCTAGGFFIHWATWEAWECKRLPPISHFVMDFTFCDYSLRPSTTPGVIQEIEADGEGLAALGEATAWSLLAQGTLDLSLFHHDCSQGNHDYLICERNVVPTASIVLPGSTNLW